MRAIPPVRKTTLQWAGAGTGVALLLGIATLWLLSTHATPARTEEPMQAAESARALPSVVVIQPKQRDVTQKIRLPGSLEPYERASLYAKVTGYLEEIRVDIGDSVSQGDVLARLAIPEMGAELQRAQAEVPAAKARLHKARAEGELAHVNYQRLADLRADEPGAVTQQAVDLAAAEEKVAVAQVSLARAELQGAQARVAELESLADYATIRAPFDGIVIARFADTGALIGQAGKTSHPIIEVVRVDKLRLVLEIPEILVPQSRPGLKLDFELDALPGRSFEAKISRLAGALNRETRTMRVEADIDNAAGLFYPGMYARVSIDLGAIPGAIVLPATTLRGGGVSPFVYAVRNGAVERIDVKILKDDGAEVVVAGGLGPNTQVVLAGPPLLEEGQSVRVRSNGDAP